MNHIIQTNNNFTACVQSVRHQHAHMILCKRSPLVNRSVDNVLFKVRPSLNQAFSQVIDVMNLYNLRIHKTQPNIYTLF